MKKKKKYDVENYRTWDTYDSKEKKFKTEVMSEKFCEKCKEFHIPNKRNRCPNCGSGYHA